MIVHINKKLSKLSPKDFEVWFSRHDLPGTWKQAYKSIGGKLVRKRKNGSDQSSSEDKKDQ